MSFVKELNEVTKVRLREGDYIVTSSYDRGFVIGPASSGSYNVVHFSVDGERLTVQHWPASTLDLSGVVPTEAECAAWAKWMLQR